MRRLAYKDLLLWKESPLRKPLIVRGVRQCGKTYLIQQFGSENYDGVAYFNYEHMPNLKDIFEGSIDPKRLISQLSISSDVRIRPGSTLIFFDEIQECPRALTSLKYFQELAPEYHIIAAGSLLGIHPNSSKKEGDSGASKSFPVGKVSYLDLYPMDFEEFLMASGDEGMHDYLSTMDVHEQIPRFMIPMLEDRLREYQVVGGMPAAVSAWIETHSLPDVRAIQSWILDTYHDDLAKHPVDYKGSLESVWESIPMQLTKDNSRFIFGQSVKGARAADLESAVQWLKNAGMVGKVVQVEKPSIPLAMYAKTFYKLYMTDVGLFSLRSGVPSDFLNSDPSYYKDFKGAMAESIVFQELNTHLGNDRFYWRSGGEAEVDFLVPMFYEPVPIEVKAGQAKSSKSLKVYREKYDPRVAVKASMDPETSIGRVTHIPLYMMWRVRDYVRAALESTGWVDPDEVFMRRHRPSTDIPVVQ